MNLAQANSVTAVVACAVTDYYHRRTVRRVRRIVEDAGGEFTGLVALTAKAKARSVLLDESDSRAVSRPHHPVPPRLAAADPILPE